MLILMRKIYLIVSDTRDDPHALFLDLDEAIRVAQKLFEEMAKTYHRSFDGGVYSCDNGTYDLTEAWNWKMDSRPATIWI